MAMPFHDILDIEVMIASTVAIFFAASAMYLSRVSIAYYRALANDALAELAAIKAARQSRRGP